MPSVNVNLSDESHAGWTRLAAEQGVTLAALLEVIGRHINDVFNDDELEVVIREARALAAERRRAGGPRRANP